MLFLQQLFATFQNTIAQVYSHDSLAKKHQKPWFSVHIAVGLVIGLHLLRKLQP